MLTRDEKLILISNMIETYFSEKRRLDDMCAAWEDDNDPSCDPGLIYEQECVVETAYTEIKNIVKGL